MLYSTGSYFGAWTSPGSSDIVAFKGGIAPPAITGNAEFVISADGSMSKGLNTGTLSWTAVMPGVASPQGFDVIHRNRWVVGAGGGIRFSADDGATWSTQTTTTTVTLRSVSMADSTAGCVVGDGGLVATYGSTVGVGDRPRIPAGVTLEGAWPNPAASATSIAWTLARPGPAMLRVLDVTGRVVATLAAGEQDAGRHLTRFETRTLTPGVYLCELTAAGRRAATRVCVVR